MTDNEPQEMRVILNCEPEMSLLAVFSAVFIALILFSEVPRPTDAGVTVEQMQQTGNMMRQACQPKHKVSDAEIEGLRDKVFPDSKNLKCFVNCVMEMMQVMKKGKLQYDSSVKAIQSMVPEELKEPQIQALTDCKTSAVGIKDNCEASYAFLKCQAEKAKNYIFV